MKSINYPWGWARHCLLIIVWLTLALLTTVGAHAQSPVTNTASVMAEQNDSNPTNNSAAACTPLNGAGTVAVGQASVTANERDVAIANSNSFACLLVVAANSGPTISQPATDPATISIPENTVAITDVNTTDDSGIEGNGTLTYTTSGPDAGSFTIGADGLLSFTTAPDFEAPGSAASTNVYSVTVTVMDAGGLTAAVALTVTVTNDPGDDSAGVEYKVLYNSTTGLYEIWMRATDTPNAPGSTGTAQVTIKAPHLSGSGVFSPTNVMAQVTETAWSIGSRTDAPAADTTADYISFELTFPTGNDSAITWQGGQEQLLFTFANAGACVGPVTLMENSDGFNVPPQNPGQQIDLFGLGNDPGNDFLGIYDLGMADCDRADLAISIGQPTPALAVGMTSTVPITVSNVSTGTATGPLTATVTLPADVSAPASFTDGDWSCTTSGQTVTCTMTNSLAGNSSSNLAVPVVPAAGTAGTQPGPFAVTIDPTLGETNTANNGPANMTPTTPVSAVGTAPTITSGSSVSIPENTTVVTTVMAGGTAPITYSIVGGADGALFTIDENTGALSFNTAPDFENATDANTDGVYEVTVRASNSAGNDAQTITVAVTDAAESSTVLVPVKAILQGAYDSQSGLMRDNLRSLPDFPLTSPYGGGETTTAGVLGISGNDAIVDWVLVELRDSSLPTTLVTSQAALLQADGDILAVDGTGTLTFTVTGSDYFVAIRHRNHLGVMTTGPVTLSASTPLVDFTMMADGSTYGSNSQKLVVDRYALWMGDLNGDNQIIGVGPNNDKNGILATVLAAPDNVNHNQNYIVTGYDASDSNLDGLMIAAGPNNDVNLIMYNVFIHPLNSNTAANFIVNGQLPMITP